PDLAIRAARGLEVFRAAVAEHAVEVEREHIHVSQTLTSDETRRGPPRASDDRHGPDAARALSAGSAGAAPPPDARPQTTDRRPTSPSRAARDRTARGSPVANTRAACAHRADSRSPRSRTVPAHAGSGTRARGSEAPRSSICRSRPNAR